MIRHVKDVLSGKAPLGAARSGHWPAVRREHLEKHPVCERCGGKEKLEAHHVLPFHLHPDLELSPGNLVTLCESGKGGVNCHLAWGHLGNFKRFNPMVLEDAVLWRHKLEQAEKEAS